MVGGRLEIKFMFSMGLLPASQSVINLGQGVWKIAGLQAWVQALMTRLGGAGLGVRSPAPVPSSVVDSLHLPEP